MQTLGFRDAEVTPPGADGGIDIRASGGVGQVKHYTGSPVGSPAVQQLLGARSTTGTAVFYSLSGFTQAAKALGEEHEVALFSYDTAGEVTPISTRANTLIERGFVAYDNTFHSVLRQGLVEGIQQYAHRVAAVSTAVATAAATDLRDRVRVLLEAGSEDEAGLLYQSTMAELRNIAAVLTELNGLEMREVGSVLTTVLRTEAWTRQLAERSGLDYDAEAAKVVEASADV